MKRSLPLSIEILYLSFQKPSLNGLELQISNDKSQMTNDEWKISSFLIPWSGLKRSLPFKISYCHVMSDRSAAL